MNPDEKNCPTIVDSTETLEKRLGEASYRLTRVADLLGGAVPEENASAETCGTSVVASIERANRLAGTIEMRICRIEHIVGKNE